MAPRAKAPVNSKKVLAKHKTVETLVQKQELEESRESPGKRKAPRRDLESQVEKILKDNFRGWSNQQVDCNSVGGLTLRQVLLRDKDLCGKGQLKMGKNYYQTLRTKYEESNSPAKMLVVKNSEEAVNNKLRSALVDLMGHRCNMQPLLAWLSEDEQVNQRSLVALLKASLDLRPAAGVKHTQCIVEVMHWLVRNKHDTTFKEEVSVLRPHFDATLVKSYVFMKKNEVSLDVFFATHKQILGLVCDVGSFEVCMKCKSAWDDVRAELAEVVVGSTLGETIFGKAYDSLKHDRAGKSVQKVMEEFRNTETEVNSETLKRYRQKFITEVKESGDDPFAAFPKKLVNITYRGFKLEVGVNSSAEHYNLAMSSTIKDIAIRNGILLPLFCENELVLPGLEVPAMAIDKAVVAESVHAREAASKLVDHLDEVTGDAIAKALVSKNALLCSIDCSFKVEETFFVSLRGDLGQEAVQTRILDAFPTHETPRSIDAVWSKLDALGKTTLFSFCGRGLAGQCATIKEWLLALKSTRSPDFGIGLEGTFLKNIRSRMENFLEWTPVGAAGSNAVRVTGKAAMDQIVAGLEARAQAAGEEEFPLNLQDIRPMQSYSWLCDDRQKALAKAWTDKILEKVGVGKDTKQQQVVPRKKHRSEKPKAKSSETVVDGYFT